MLSFLDSFCIFLLNLPIGRRLKLNGTYLLLQILDTQQSGAYWKNDKENKMLTRINGVAFRNQEELDAWEKEQQEARERDHRKIGKEMGLFMTDDLVGRGLPMFLPAGYTVWQELENYIKEKERARGYLHVMTPCIGTVNLYKTSGHWDHYRENMFPAMEMEG